MREVAVTNRTRGITLALARVAERRAERRRGLLGTAGLEPGEGLLIRPCRSVHTVGMAYPIDVLFLNGNGRVIKMLPDMRPGRVTWPAWRARMCLELSAGAIRASGTRCGDVIELQHASG